MYAHMVCASRLRLDNKIQESASPKLVELRCAVHYDAALASRENAHRERQSQNAAGNRR